MQSRLALLVTLVLTLVGCPSDPIVVDADSSLDSGYDTATSTDTLSEDAEIQDSVAELDDVETDAPQDTVPLEPYDVLDAAPDTVEEDTAPPKPLFGNTCDIPIDIPAATLPFAQASNTAGGTDDYSLEGGCDTGGDIGKGISELVYRFKPAVTGHHLIGLSPATFSGENPTVIYVAEDCANIADTCVAVSGNLSGGGIFSVYLQTGKTYWIFADGLLDSDQGAYTLIMDEAVCVPTCPGPGTECGKDGCGGLCGVGCADELACNIDGFCVTPEAVKGNTCTDMFEVESLPLSSSGDTYYGWDNLSVGANACQGETESLGLKSHEHIYHLQAPVTGKYAISLNASYDAALYVIRDCEDPGGTCVAAADASLLEEELELQLQEGKDYYIVVDGYGGDDNDHGTYGLTISEPCVPDCLNKTCGDDGCGEICGACDAGLICSEAGVCAVAPTGDACNDPLIITDVPYTHEGDTSEYGNDFYYEEGDCPGVEYGWGKGSNDVVYAFSPSKTDLYELHVQAAFDTTIYVSSSCDTLADNCIQAADEPVSGEWISMWLSEGQTYFIVVDGYGNLSSPSGPFTFSLSPACIPACEGKNCGDDGCGGLCGECMKGSFCNDQSICEGKPGDTCETPFVLESAPSTVEGDTSDASSVYGVPYDACPDETILRGATSKDEVWAFTPTETANYTFTVDAQFVSAFYILTDCSLFTYECFIEQDPGPLVWWKVEDECENTGDSCQAIGTGVGVEQSKTSKAVALEAGQTYFIVVDGTSFNQDFSGPYTLSVSAPCIPQCDGKMCGSDSCGLTCGECELGQVCSLSDQCMELDGNTCETAFEADSLPFVASGSTDDSTNVYGLAKFTCPDQDKQQGGAGSNDEVYSFTAPETALYDLTLEADFDSVIYVTTDCAGYQSTCFFEEALGYLQWVATTGGCSTGDSCVGMSLPEGDEPLKVEMEEGTTYYVIVDGSAGLSNFAGDYTLTIEKACVPQCEDKECGDDGCGEPCGTCPDGFECSEEFTCVDKTNQDGNTCGTAWQVGAMPFLGTGDTTDDADIYPTNQCVPGDVPGSKDEVWRFTAPKTGVFVFSVKPDPPFETVYSITKGCSNLQFECVVGTQAETISETLEEGVTYFVIVDSNEDGSQEGTYVLEIKEAE
jgi:hypothetical protein